jgi:hypothetical protein
MRKENHSACAPSPCGAVSTLTSAILRRASRRHEGKNFRNMEEVEGGFIIGDPATKWRSYTVTVKIVIVPIAILLRSPRLYCNQHEGRDKH